MRRADHPGTCDRCHGPIRYGDPIIIRRHVWIHAACANGGDDR